MRRHRKSEGFNLAFLDIMACGLGAVVLVLMLVKHNVGYSATETDLLNEDLATLQQQEQALQDLLAELEDVSRSEAEKIAQLKAKISRLEAELRKKNQSLINRKDQLAALKNDIKNTPKAKKADLIEDGRGGEENYLMGLKVEGPRIAILLDSSASMTDEKLIDIIRRKNSNDKDKQSGPKWIRTKKVVKWLLGRVPKGSRATLISYNDNATKLGKTDWFDPADTTELTAVFQDIDKLVPQGPTNLQRGLKALAGLSPSNIYVITDGLPTSGDSSYASLNPFSSCSSLLGKSSTISGECRVKLFRQTLIDSSPSSAVVNVVLLPIEGDPDASNEYWYWTAKNKGLLISPAENWP